MENNALNHSEFYILPKSDELFSPGTTQNIETERIAWFLINEIQANNQFIREMIRTNDKIGNLTTAIFSYPKNLDVLERLITRQFSKITNQGLMGKSDLIE